MAIEPSGVSLEAKGFDDYIRKLTAIERKNRAVFDQKFRNTGKSFEEVIKLANQYEKELKDIERAERSAARAANQRGQAAGRAGRQGGGGASGGAGALAAGALAAGVAGIALAAAAEANEFRKESIELARIQASAEAQLAAAIKSTGGIAGLTAQELKNHAGALQGVTNFGDEATIQAQAQLLTFTKIGSETFPRATEAILDLATRMEGDLKGATIQVGKALNDPIAGLTALTRSGIQFTDAQKETIKGFVETNNIAAAQAVILQELETQFGGSAEAARVADGGNIALSNSFGDLQEQIGGILIIFGKTFNTVEIGMGVIGELSQAMETLRQISVIVGAGINGVGSIILNTFERVKTTVTNIGNVFRGEAVEPIKSFSQILDEASEVATNKFKELAFSAESSFVPGIQGAEDFSEAIEESVDKLKAYENALKQAENLQLSFTRQAEDAARKLKRANEDIARDQERQVKKLLESQAKDREKALNDQIKQRKEFEESGAKEIAKAEKEISKERAKASESRLKAQKKLQDKLRQQEEKFRLSQIQGERRFQLAEKRLRAEGDILALQQLREDRDLQLQEEKENFGQQQKETAKSGKEQIREQDKVSNDRINEIKDRIEQERAELLASFDQQLSDLQQQQLEERTNLQNRFAEQAEDRQIALAREEEDRRISQARQLEDLGRSLAEQEGVTKEGSEKIAMALENVFGIDGSASNIMTGFTDKTESDFRKLFENLEDIVEEKEDSILNFDNVGLPPALPDRARRTPAGIPAFQEGGIVPGPTGSPQLILAHGGERVLPTGHQQFAMNAPVIPSQNVDVNMSGGFNINAPSGTNEEVIKAATAEMVENFRIAVSRMTRRVN